MALIETNTGADDSRHVSGLIVSTIVGAFTILTAFSIRDSVIQGIALVSPNDTTKKFVFTLAMTVFFFVVTVVMAYMWQDKLAS